MFYVYGNIFCTKTKRLSRRKEFLLFVGLMCKILLGLREASTEEMPCTKLPVKWSLGIKVYTILVISSEFPLRNITMIHCTYLKFEFIWDGSVFHVVSQLLYESQDNKRYKAIR